MSFKIDLHTHSQASPDGGLSVQSYKDLLVHKTLDYIAITDHGTVDFALKLQETLGERIIVGEEISTSDGEIIGLFLKQEIPSGLTPERAVEQIKAQNGLVLIPHPFETVRSGITESALESVAQNVDIIEIANGRAVFQNKSNLAKKWQRVHGWAGAANSDAHAVSGCGKTFSVVEEPPTKENLVEQLLHADFVNKFPGVRALTAPKTNRFKKRFTTDA